MSHNGSVSGFNQDRAAQTAARNTRLKDAKLITRSIVGDEDGHWLMDSVGKLRKERRFQIESDSDRVFCFLSDKAEEIVDRSISSMPQRDFRMPRGFTVTHLVGVGYQTWRFRIDNSLVGSEREYFDVKYRKIHGGYKLVYVFCRRGEGSGRRAGTRSRGNGPDRSL